MARKCKQCKTEIPIVRLCEDIIQKKGFCGATCLIEVARAKQQAAAKKKAKSDQVKKDAEFKEMKERVSAQGTKAKAMKAAQSAFNAFIRARDEKLPCISCGKSKVVSGGYKGAGGWDAGHYRSRGATPELRFHEDNVFKQCVSCNRDQSGNVVNMRIGILKRIGQERIDFIEGPHKTIKHSLQDLRNIQSDYKAKLKSITS